MPTYIGTPMRTPRKVLFQSTKKKALTNKRMYTRIGGRLRRVSSVKKKRGVPRKTLKSRLQDLVLDSNMTQVDIASSAKRNWQESLLGSNLIPGVSVRNRIGQNVYLKGLDIRGIYYNSNPATLGTTIAAAPTYLHMFLVRSNRSDGPKGYWYVHPSQGEGVVNYDDPFGSGAGAGNAAGDAQRTKLRLNTLTNNDLTIVWKTTLKVGTRVAGSPQDYCSRKFQFYIPLNNVKIEYETTSGAGNYAGNEVRPCYWLIWYQSQPDVAADDTVSNASMNARYTLYYKA